MTLEKEEHRTFLLEALAAITIPTSSVDLFVEVREAIKGATVPAPPAEA